MNGNEHFVLVDANNVVLMGADEPAADGMSYEYGFIEEWDGSYTGAYFYNDIDTATPGIPAFLPAGTGLVISEWSDAEDWTTEFIEITWLP